MIELFAPQEEECVQQSSEAARHPRQTKGHPVNRQQLGFHYLLDLKPSKQSTLNT